MKTRFNLFRRAGVFYTEDTAIGKQTSLRTRDETEAKSLLNARNEAQRQPALNLHLARATSRPAIPHLWNAHGRPSCSNYNHAATVRRLDARSWQTANTGVRLRFCRFGYARKRAVPTLQNQRLPPGRLPDSANSCRFHSAPLQSRQRTAPPARFFIPLHFNSEIIGDRPGESPLSCFMQEP